MKDHSSSNKKSQEPANKDISHVLEGWDFEAGSLNVRKINGADGRPKLQMRLDLGLLQMEMNGRPDGKRPHGFESLLEFHERQLEQHKALEGSDDGFQLTSVQCQGLREEAVMYYHRYLSLFVLEDFNGVVRDTARNLRVLDLCGQFGAEEEDRLVLEQYRPYITMMNARAKASIELKEKNFPQAMATVEEAISSIKEFFSRFGHEQAYSQSNEVKVLKRFAKEIRKRMPVDPLVKLQKRLEKAVKAERYEEAAGLRDRIEAIKRAHAEGAGMPE